MNGIEQITNQFGPVTRDAKIHVKSNFEILSRPEKIQVPKRRKMVRPEGFVQPKLKKVKKQETDKW